MRSARRIAREYARRGEGGRAGGARALRVGTMAILAGLAAFGLTALLLNLPMFRAAQPPPVSPATVALPAPLAPAGSEDPRNVDADFTPAARAEEIPGVFRVIDGDTMEMAGRRIRIFGIDAPESAQTCVNANGRYACGSRATEVLAALVTRHSVTCVTLGHDRYRRDIARCRRDDGVDIGAEMVRQGWAVAYRRFSLDYVALEAAARLDRRGIWGGAFDSPEAWRAAR